MASLERKLSFVCLKLLEGSWTECCSPSKLAAWARPSWRWARGSPTWVEKIPERSQTEANKTIPFSLLFSKNSETKTNHPNEHTQLRSTWSEQSPTRWTRNTDNMATSTATSSTYVSQRSSGSCDQLSTWDTPRETTTEPAAPDRKPSDWKTSPKVRSWSAWKNQQYIICFEQYMVTVLHSVHEGVQYNDVTSWIMTCHSHVT